MRLYHRVLTRQCIAVFLVDEERRERRNRTTLISIKVSDIAIHVYDHGEQNASKVILAALSTSNYIPIRRCTLSMFFACSCPFLLEFPSSLLCSGLVVLNLLVSFLFHEVEQDRRSTWSLKRGIRLTSSSSSSPIHIDPIDLGEHWNRRKNEHLVHSLRQWPSKRFHLFIANHTIHRSMASLVHNLSRRI